MSAAQVAATLHLHLAIAPSYFVEIAKLRALRRLWATLLHSFGLPAALNQHLRIHAATATWTQTTLDAHTNLLRHTTEAMSAVLGGADSLTVAPYDSLFAEANDFSGRLARNLSILLREEAGLGRVQDPAAGSYYLETLTDQLAQEAWGLFQRMEAAGGLPQVRALLLEEIRTVSTETFRRIAAGQQVVVGTNRFQNRDEQFSFHPKKLLRSSAFDVTRAAYPTEVLRLATALHFERREKKSKRAAVVLLGAKYQPDYPGHIREHAAAPRAARNGGQPPAGHAVAAVLIARGSYADVRHPRAVPALCPLHLPDSDREAAFHSPRPAWC